MYLGIDCGTQGTKVVICDSASHQVVATGYAKHDLITNEHGRREQPVEWWIDALKSALQQAINDGNIQVSKIKGIGVSGQQHGMVLLDKQDQPLHPAKLWCDTESSQQNSEIIDAIGGDEAFLQKVGIQLQTGYTASKIRWFYQHYPQRYSDIAKIMLPHDYLNYWMTGNFVTEYGDASGTGYFDVNQRHYDQQVLDAIAPGLQIEQHLPRLIAAEQVQGYLTTKAAAILGLPANILVSSGGGDNMMGAIGTGNIQPGVVTMSLGTSGTLYAYSDQPMPNLNGMIADFCSSSNGWLPLICTMNVTASTSLMQTLFNLDLASFTDLLSRSSPGANGITLLPFFNGERVPPLPDASATIMGLTSENMTQANLIRATTEAATFTLRYGLDLFREQGLQPKQIRLIGGGAKNPLWRQMVADIMDTDVICPVEHEAAALGAAIQAMWCYGLTHGQPVTLKALCDRWVTLDMRSLTQPDPINRAKYAVAYQSYQRYLTQFYPQHSSC